MGLAAARAIGPDKQIFVCLDNTSVVNGLNGTPPESSRSVFIRFKEIAEAHEPDAIVKWIPGHKAIKSNEAAKKLAKDGAMMALSATNAPTVAWARRSINKKRKTEFLE
ncbi:hypothetical protein F5Y08DRAFT_78687 [Xylaria arbuscula]|nr:hypothetical protein F5Y08DRAFT_78687 [Xylaria arbuscula]